MAESKSGICVDIASYNLVGTAIKVANDVQSGNDTTLTSMSAHSLKRAAPSRQTEELNTLLQKAVVPMAPVIPQGQVVPSPSVDPKHCKHRFIEKQVFECEHCNRYFTTAYNLTRHKKSNCQENVCQKCNMRFQRTEQLQEHNLTCTGKQPYQCEFCGKSFLKNNNLARHRLTHTERCELCHALFYKRIPLITLYPEEKFLACKHCEDKFKSQESLEKHFQMHYESNANQCEHCFLGFGKKRQLLLHKKNVHSDELPPTKVRKTYECSVCHRVFLKKKDRKKHLQIHIEAGIKIFNCKVCGKSYTAEKTLRMHMIKHGSDDKKPRCKVCNKMFSHPFSLRYHMRIHNNVKPCVCHVCGTGFRQAGHLSRHLLTHSAIPKGQRERSHKCTVCQKGYTSEQDLKHHMYTHRAERKFSCPFCTKTFLFRRTLNHHVNTHTGSKPYQCSKCDKSFAQPGSLHKHKQTHADEARIDEDGIGNMHVSNMNSDKDNSKQYHKHETNNAAISSDLNLRGSQNVSNRKKVQNHMVTENSIPHDNDMQIINYNGMVFRNLHNNQQATPNTQIIQNQLQPTSIIQNQLPTVHISAEDLQRAPENLSGNVSNVALLHSNRSDCLEQLALQHVHLPFQPQLKSHPTPKGIMGNVNLSEVTHPGAYWAQQGATNLVHYSHQTPAPNMFLPPPPPSQPQDTATVSSNNHMQ